MRKVLFAIIMIFAFCASSVSAHDVDYGKTHNHYDYVVVATVDRFDEISADLSIVKYIVSRKSCNDNKGSHVAGKNMTVGIDNSEYQMLKNGAVNVVAVIDKNKNGESEIFWLYETDSTDYKTLMIINPELDAYTAAFNDFINTNGKFCNYSFEGIFDKSGNYLGTKVTRGETGKIIYTPQTGYIRNGTWSQIDNNVKFYILCSSSVIIIALLCIIAYRKRRK